MQEYFDGTIVSLRTRKESYLERKSLFRKVRKTKKINEALVKLVCTKNLTLAIPVSDEDFPYLKAGQNVSVHLNFDFEFACFHYPEKHEKEEKKVIRVKRKNSW